MYTLHSRATIYAHILAYYDHAGVYMVRLQHITLKRNFFSRYCMRLLKIYIRIYGKKTYVRRCCLWWRDIILYVSEGWYISQDLRNIRYIGRNIPSHFFAKFNVEGDMLIRKHLQKRRRHWRFVFIKFLRYLLNNCL